MAVGVPETDVFAAADRVLSRGERPTVERVRAELGRGSPARVGQLLETWWDALAKRLAGHTQLPEVPPNVASAFVDVWGVALAAGQAHGEAQVAPERAALADVIGRADAAVAIERAGRDAANARAAAAQSAAFQAAERIQDLGRLLEAQARELEDVRRERDLALQAGQRLQTEVDQAAAAAKTLQADAARERQALLDHIRAVEDRMHGEVDRVRGELKGLTKERGVLTQTIGRLEQQLREAALAVEVRTATVRRIQAEVQRRKAKETIAVDWLREALKGPDTLPRRSRETIKRDRPPSMTPKVNSRKRVSPR